MSVTKREAVFITVIVACCLTGLGLGVTYAINPKLLHLGAASPHSADTLTYMKWKESVLVPVRSQRQCTSCWSFSIVDMLADKLQILSGGEWGRKHLSVQYLLSCWHGHSGCGIGASPEDVYDLPQLTEDGVPLETEFPYTASDKTPCREIASDAIRIRAIKGTYRDLCQDPATIVFGNKWKVIEDNIRRMKEALLKGPIVGTLRVHKDLYDYRSDGVYKLTPGSPFVGYHCVEICGWCNKGVNWKEDGFSEGYWIIRSSWSLGWPTSKVPHGFCYVRMGFNEVDVESRASVCDVEIPEFLKAAVAKTDPFDSAYLDYDSYVDDPEREAYLGAVEEAYHFKAKYLKR
jgi:hypothetical protein